MTQFKSSFLLLVLVIACLAQTGTPLANPSVRRIGEQLMCQCGCGATVTSCNMINCHFSDPVRQKILAMVNAGTSDSEIIDSFVKEYGKVILMKPPSEGFNLMAWVMPFAGLAFGLWVLWYVIRRISRPQPASTGPPMSAEDYARYQERIEKDLSNLDS
ncbi:MAG: cytochrome c-type biogenesis protein CcmH [Acidobacteria bacterium]|nr:cytochrome c-type biogenesis protein CcmH [Acidobacteriota bacterium]